MSHVFKHPKYYKELRKIRARPAPDPVVVTEEDLKALEEIDKQQASNKLVTACSDQKEPQAPGDKPQASSDKRQASSKQND